MKAAPRGAKPRETISFGPAGSAIPSSLEEPRPGHVPGRLRSAFLPRADLLIEVLRAANRGDQTLFRQALEALIAEERKKQHHVLADRLVELLKTNGPPVSRQPAGSDDRVLHLFYEITPKRKLDDLVLPEVVRTTSREIIEEHTRR